MARNRRIEAAARTATVDAGVILDVLQDAVVTLVPDGRLNPGVIRSGTGDRR